MTWLLAWEEMLVGSSVSLTGPGVEAGVMGAVNEGGGGDFRTDWVIGGSSTVTVDSVVEASVLFIFMRFARCLGVSACEAYFIPR